MNSIKTILIAHNYTRDYLSAMSYHLAHYLANNGYHVVFISHRPYFDQTVQVNSNLTVLSWCSHDRPTALKDFKHFAKIYRRYKPDIVIGHVVGANISILMSKVLSLGKVKTFEYYHTLSSQNLLDKKKGVLNNLIFHAQVARKYIFYKLLDDKVLATSNLAAKDYKSYYSLHNVVEHTTPLEDRFDGKVKSIDQKLVIGFLGRLDPSKGMDILIEAMNILTKDSSFIFKIAGSGAYDTKIKSISDNVNIIYIGRIPYTDVDAFVKSCDIILIPSLTDNLVTVGIEALMNKRCLMITNKTGLSYYLTNGIDALLIEPTTQSIVDNLRYLNSNRHLLENIAEKGRKLYIEKFNMESYFSQMNKILFG